MTKIEKEISEVLKKNKGNVKIFWDMDGTFTSMEMHELENKLEHGFFYRKRPIKTMIRIVKKFHELGAKTYILTFCSFNYQKEDKIRLLKETCPFIRIEDMIIIPRKESSVKTAESKQYLKAEYMKEHVTSEDLVYFVDDNESVLLGTKEKLPFINIVSPMDFIV